MADCFGTPTLHGPCSAQLWAARSQWHTSTWSLDDGQFRGFSTDSGAIQISNQSVDSFFSWSSSRSVVGTPGVHVGGGWPWKPFWSAYPAQKQTPHPWRTWRTRTSVRLNSCGLATKNQSRLSYAGQLGCATNERKGHHPHTSDEAQGSVGDLLLAHLLNSSSARSCFS